VFDTQFAKLGVAILGPVVSGSRALYGADGGGGFAVSDGHRFRAAGCELDSSGHCKPHHAGHAAANIVPLGCVQPHRMERREVHDEFYGSSIIADHTGEKSGEADRTSETVSRAFTWRVPGYRSRGYSATDGPNSIIRCCRSIGRG